MQWHTCLPFRGRWICELKASLVYVVCFMKPGLQSGTLSQKKKVGGGGRKGEREEKEGKKERKGKKEALLMGVLNIYVQRKNP